MYSIRLLNIYSAHTEKYTLKSSNLKPHSSHYPMAALRNNGSGPRTSCIKITPLRG